MRIDLEVLNSFDHMITISIMQSGDESDKQTGRGRRGGGEIHAPPKKVKKEKKEEGCAGGKQTPLCLLGRFICVFERLTSVLLCFAQHLAEV